MTTGQSAQIGSVRQTNKSYKRRFIVNQSNQQQQQQQVQVQNQVAQNQHVGNQPTQLASNNLQMSPPGQSQVTQQQLAVPSQATQQTLINTQRAAPSRGGGGPSTYYDDNQSDTKPTQSAQESHHSSQFGGGNKVSISINMSHASQPSNSVQSAMNAAQTGSSYQISSTNFQQRIYKATDINFHGSNFQVGSAMA